MGRTVDAPERKMVIFCAVSLLILLVSLSGCGSDIVPTPTPPATETVISASTSPVQPSGAPDEVYFPKHSSLLYDIEAPYANLFDAIMDYYGKAIPIILSFRPFPCGVPIPWEIPGKCIL